MPPVQEPTSGNRWAAARRSPAAAASRKRVTSDMTAEFISDPEESHRKTEAIGTPATGQLATTTRWRVPRNLGFEVA